jgi:DNA repair exonuclease SbcCD ATPase subunit
MELAEVNFAGQFDRPYLLTDSGSQVAHTLGRLTNVTLVFEAAREANRRKLETARALKAAEAQLEDLKQQGRGFGNLKDRVAQANLAQEIVAVMAVVEADRARLAFLYSEWQQARSLSAAAEQRLTSSALPSAGELESALARRERLGSLLADLETARRWEAAAEREERAAREAGEAAEQQLHALLADAGTCPTCGQAVSAA